MQTMTKTDLLLCAQQALLGNITPSMRAICVDVSDRKLVLRAFFEKPPLEDEEELLADITTEIIAAFPEIEEVIEEGFVSSEPLGKLNMIGDWVYMRDETLG